MGIRISNCFEKKIPGGRPHSAAYAVSLLGPIKKRRWRLWTRALIKPPRLNKASSQWVSSYPERFIGQRQIHVAVAAIQKIHLAQPSLDFLFDVRVYPGK